MEKHHELASMKDYLKNLKGSMEQISKQHMKHQHQVKSLQYHNWSNTAYRTHLQQTLILNFQKETNNTLPMSLTTSPDIQMCPNINCNRHQDKLKL